MLSNASYQSASKNAFMRQARSNNEELIMRAQKTMRRGREAAEHYKGVKEVFQQLQAQYLAAQNRRKPQELFPPSSAHRQIPEVAEDLEVKLARLRDSVRRDLSGDMEATAVMYEEAWRMYARCVEVVNTCKGRTEAASRRFCNLASLSAKSSSSYDKLA